MCFHPKDDHFFNKFGVIKFDHKCMVFMQLLASFLVVYYFFGDFYMKIMQFHLQLKHAMNHHLKCVSFFMFTYF
jgi:hypothetical protein